MPKLKFLLFLFFTLLCGRLSLAAGFLEVGVQHLTSTDGLAGNSVRQVFQDSKGFIWFATISSGLSRYDGYTFTTFYTSDQEFGLSDSRIRSIQEDKNNFLWISTMADGINCYDLTRDCFVDFTGNGEYHSLYSSISFFGDDIWLWGKAQGCRKVTYIDNKFTSTAFSVENNELPSDYINFLAEGSAGRIWIGTNQGLCSYDVNGIHWWNDDFVFLWTCSINGKDFFLTSDGTLWLAGGNEELIKVNQIPQISKVADIPGEFILNEKWIIFTSQKGYLFDPDNYSLSATPDELNVPNGHVIENGKGDYLIYNRTGKVRFVDSVTEKVIRLDLVPADKIRFWGERYSFCRDSRDVLWISTHGNGLFAYDLRNDRLQQFFPFSAEASSVASNILLYVMEDRSGSIWVGSEFAGVFHFRVINQGAAYLHFTDDSGEIFSNTVRMSAMMPEGDIWLATRDGRVHVYNSLMTQLKSTYDYSTNIYAVEEDPNGVKWLGTRGEGLYIGNDRYRNIFRDYESLGADNIFCIARDSSDRMWIGTFGGGLNLAIAGPDGKYTFRRFLNDSYGRRRIRSLMCDKNGRMWAGTDDGIVVFEPDKMIADPSSYHYYGRRNQQLRSDEIRSIVQDSKGNIWIAETGIGFCVFTPDCYESPEIRHFSVEDGLINGMVQAFAEDKNGHMWITTEYGVSCFNPDDETFRNFLFSSNMQSNVCCDNNALCLVDGRIIIGTNYGLAIIDPDKVSYADNDAVVSFTDLKVNGISVHPQSEKSPLGSSITYEDLIVLAHDQNSISISFSTMEYAYFSGSQYSYKLDNYDDQWSIPSEMNFAAYKNLHPGTYFLRVRACNAMGIWSENESVLKIVVKPSFWGTDVAFIILFLLGAGIFYLIFRVLRKMNSLRNNIRVEKQLTEYKLVFFTNISHEFRTPLTLILNAVEKLRRSSNSEEKEEAVNVMEKGSSRMLRLVNQLLEFRKIQNNKLALALEKTDVIAYIYEIYLTFKDTAQSKWIDFEFIPNVSLFEMYIDKGNVDKVVYNLLSNALKYTPSEGCVALHVTVDEHTQTLIIQVIDTGVGIPKDKRGQLFTRFMQSSFSNDSIGVGLNLTYELVTVHKGTIRYEENQPEGSIFTVSLPTDPSIYSEKDFLIPDNRLLLEKAELEKNKSRANKTNDNHSKEMSRPFNPQRILVIEDDHDIRHIIEEELGKYFTITTASTGEEGLKKLEENNIDLIVCDVMMPGMSGFEVTKRIKQDFNTCHIPVILLTALNSPESHLEGIESGADAYITKPFSSQLVLARVLKLIEQRGRLREKFSNDLTLTSSILCTTDKDKEFIERLTATIEEELGNSAFSADDFATKMRMGRSAFFNKVRIVTGYAPKEYIRIVRMKKAAEFLLSGDFTSAEIAYKVGMNDPSYFTKCFRLQFGITPKAYVIQHKKTSDTGHAVEQDEPDPNG